MVWVLVCQQKLPHRKMFMGYMMGSMVGMSVAGYVYQNMVSKLFTLGVALHFGFLRSGRRGGCGCSGSCCCVRPFLSDKNSHLNNLFSGECGVCRCKFRQRSATRREWASCVCEWSSSYSASTVYRTTVSTFRLLSSSSMECLNVCSIAKFVVQCTFIGFL